MHAYTTPILIEPGYAGIPLERVALTGIDATHFTERWLQQLLFDHPESLPMREIDPSIGALVPVCMELDTGPGPADILYMTPLGQIVLVETKLYRNPEARRTVIAQILDYARAVTCWTYEVLDRKIRAAFKADQRSLTDRMRAAAALVNAPFNEAQFVDAVNRNLARADIHLLIIGDGITSGTRSLVEFLEQHGSLHFSFALIEAAVYRTPSAGYLLQARLLAQTEIVRRVLLIDRDGAPVPEAAPETAQEQASGDAMAAWYVAFWTDYLVRLRTGLEDLLQPLPATPGRSTNIFLPLPPGRSQCWISAFVSRGRKSAGVYFAMGSAYERAPDIMQTLATERDALEAETGVALQWGAPWSSYYIGASFDYTSLEDSNDRDRVLRELVTMTNRFVNTFRPRMEALAKK